MIEGAVRYARFELPGFYVAHHGQGIETRSNALSLYIDPSRTDVEISLQDAWDGNGVFVFPAAPAIDRDRLLEQIADVVAKRPDWKLIWIDDRLPRGVSIRDGEVSAASTVLATTDLRLDFAKGTQVTLDTDTGQVHIAASEGLSLPHELVAATTDVSVRLSGDNPGALRFEADLPTGLSGSMRAMGDLDLPVFAIPSGSASVTLHPAAVAQASRTSFQLRSSQPVSTAFRNPRGERIELTPGDVVPRLSDRGETSFAPAGRYEATAPQRLVCGLVGSEFLNITAQTTVDFAAGDELLDTWVAVGSSDGTPVSYFSQPLTNGFHGPASPDYLPWLDVVAGTVGPDTPVPIAPYADIADADVANLEQSVARVRSEIILRAAADGTADQMGTADTVTALTPAGFSAQFTGGVMQLINLASVGDTHLAIDTSQDSALRAALASDDQVLVMDRRPSFAPSSDTLTIDGWSLDFTAETWDRSNTILILKQTTSRTLGDVLGDPAQWTLAAALNDSPAATARQLQRWAEASADSADPAIREAWKRVGMSPDWQGVLAVSVGSPLSGLPDELRALQAGITGDLIAHHVAIDGRPASEATADSTIGAVLTYPRPGQTSQPGPRGGGFGFTVDSLRVGFADTTIASFAAAIELDLSSLLGTPIAGGASITLEGHEQTRNGRPHYFFTSNEATDLELRSPILVGANFTDAEFSTLRTTPDIEARFAFNGSLSLAEAPSDIPDLVGYRRIGVTNLGLSMSFPSDDPQAISFVWVTGEVALTGSRASVRLSGRLLLAPRRS